MEYTSNRERGKTLPATVGWTWKHSAILTDGYAPQQFLPTHCSELNGRFQLKVWCVCCGFFFVVLNLSSGSVALGVLVLEKVECDGRI